MPKDKDEIQEESFGSEFCEQGLVWLNEDENIFMPRPNVRFVFKLNTVKCILYLDELNKENLASVYLIPCSTRSGGAITIRNLLKDTHSFKLYRTDEALKRGLRTLERLIEKKNPSYVKFYEGKQNWG